MAKSKYAHVIDKLPRMFGENPDYQSKVDAMKKELQNDPLFETSPSWLAQEYAAIRDEKDVVEQQLSDVNLRMEAVKQLMAEQFEAEGISSLRTVMGQTVSVFLEPVAQVVDKEAFRRWCESDPDLRLKMALPWQSTNTLTKDRLANGEPEPPGVTTWAKTTVRLGNR